MSTRDALLGRMWSAKQRLSKAMDIMAVALMNLEEVNWTEDTIKERAKKILEAYRLTDKLPEELLLLSGDLIPVDEEYERAVDANIKEMQGEDPDRYHVTR